MKHYLIILISFFSIPCYAGDNMNITTNTIQVSDQVIEKLSHKKIYFGHQSVGNNIMKGIAEVLSDSQKKNIKLLDSMDASNYKDSMFAHSRIGYNMDPLSKIIGFNNYMHNLNHWKPDLAMFKFCYIDIKENSDVNKIYSEYKTRMTQLKNSYPDTVFIHFTVPLTVVQSGLREDIKKLLGKLPGGATDNIQRNKYNDLLRQNYTDKEPIFDLAKIESTRMNNSRVTFEVNEKEYFSMSPEYASDGRHLNERGRQIVAQELLGFLANISK